MTCRAYKVDDGVYCYMHRCLWQFRHFAPESCADAEIIVVDDVHVIPTSEVDLHTLMRGEPLEWTLQHGRHRYDHSPECPCGHRTTPTGREDATANALRHVADVLKDAQYVRADDDADEEQQP